MGVGWIFVPKHYAVKLQMSLPQDVIGVIIGWKSTQSSKIGITAGSDLHKLESGGLYVEGSNVVFSLAVPFGHRRRCQSPLA